MSKYGIVVNGAWARIISGAASLRSGKFLNSQPDAGEVLAGLVERVTYHNSENGFCVLRARARGHRDVLTVVGCCCDFRGRMKMASGQGINDRTHGPQFNLDSIRFTKTQQKQSVGQNGLCGVRRATKIPYLTDMFGTVLDAPDQGSGRQTRGGLGHYGGNVQRTHSLAGVMMKSPFEGRHVGPEMHAGFAELRLRAGQTCPDRSLA
jgi:hypothetical protein